VELKVEVEVEEEEEVMGLKVEIRNLI